jgi:hypothetical protein
VPYACLNRVVLGILRCLGCCIARNLLGSGWVFFFKSHLVHHSAPSPAGTRTTAPVQVQGASLLGFVHHRISNTS